MTGGRARTVHRRGPARALLAVSVVALLVPTVASARDLATPPAAVGAVVVTTMDGAAVTPRGVALEPGLPVHVVVPTSTAAVGLTWAPASTAPTAFSVRSRGPGGWSPWVAVEDEHDHGDESGAAADTTTTARHGIGPIWTGSGTTAIELVASGAAPLDLAVHTTDATPALLPTPVTRTQTIRPRSAWASPGWSEQNCPGGPAADRAVDAVIIHHTATTNAYGADQVDDVLRSIHRFHTRTRGWCDIAYNVLVDRFGQAWEGRTGGTLLPIHGGHAMGFNTATTGIAVLGNHDQATLPEPVADTLAVLAAWKGAANDFDPTATVVRRSSGSTSIRAGTDVRIPRISGHRDVSATSCPGHDTVSRLPDIRRRAGAAMQVPASFRLDPATAVLGDWDGDGSPDAGTYTTGVFDLRGGLGEAASTPGAVVRFGLPGDVAVTGDWNGDGIDTVGVLRGSTFHLLDVNRTPVGVPLVDGDRRVTPAVPADFPISGARPLVGDWDGDGVDTVGFANRGEIIRFADAAGRVVLDRGRIGAPGDRFEALDWDADGTDEVTLRRAGVVYAPLDRTLARWIAATRVADDRSVFVADWSRRALPTLVTVTPDGLWDPTTPVGL